MKSVNSCFLVMLLFLPSVPPSGASEPGYLRTVGPPRLRFVPPAEQPATDPMIEINFAILAAIPTNAEPARAANTTNTAATVPVVATNPPAMNAVSTAVNPATSTGETSTAASTPQPVPAVQGVMPQPQLFLQYFTPEYLPGTNGYGYGFGLPVSFLPPQPWRTGNSSATYQTVPPEKP